PGARAWGLSGQLYGRRSARNWGMGDFTDLAMFARATGSRGAATLGINPIHALFAAEPRHISPYSPSSRTWLDYLYIDVTAVPGFVDEPAAQTPQTGLAAARKTEFVDHAVVAGLKRPVLEALFGRFRKHDLAAGAGARSSLGQSFRAFQREGGKPLVAFALFEA